MSRGARSGEGLCFAYLLSDRGVHEHAAGSERGGKPATGEKTPAAVVGHPGLEPGANGLRMRTNRRHPSETVR